MLRAVVTCSPLVAVVAIILIDAEFRGRSPLLIHGAADEVSHLLSGLVFVIALTRLIPVVQVLPALVGSVGMDLDHIPELLGWLEPDGPSSRFITHSVLTAVIVGGVALVDRGRSFVWLSASFGLLVHLFRDAATGSIIAAWPLSHSPLTIPYAVYVGGLAGAALLSFFGRSVISQSRRYPDNHSRVGRTYGD